MADLALVESGVPLLQVLDLQHPVEGALLVQHREARVRGVGERAGRQDVPVAHADPRDLETRDGIGS